MPLTRTQVLQSKEFRQLFNLPNDIKCAQMKAFQDAGSTPFDGWHAGAPFVQDNDVDVLTAGMIFVGGIQNNADAGAPDGITQILYVLIPNP